MSSTYQQKLQSGEQMVSLSPREAFEFLKDSNAILVDIRPEYETNYRVFDVPKVFYLPYDSYREYYQAVSKDTFLIVADSAGTRSSEVARYLVENGYLQVACLAGGVIAWDRAGLPLSKDVDYEMNGGCACKLKSKKS